VLSIGADSFNVTSTGRVAPGASERRYAPRGGSGRRQLAPMGAQQCRTRPGLRHLSMGRRVRSAALADSAVGTRSDGWMSGAVRPDAIGQYFCQREKESEHGNEAQKGREEDHQEEGCEEEKESCKTQSSSQEENGEEEEKGGQEGRQEKSCEETRQEESQATDEGGQACGETSGTCPDGGSCCTVDGGGPWGEDCPESRCCLAVPNRVSALGGGRIVCGRALCRQSPIRRHSALEVPVPPALATEDARILSAGRWRSRGRLSPKFFYCASQHKCLIRRRFSAA